ncbi:hypothetical protein [Sedimentitalea nanhaiensis]|uniref:hypothetical protein n=1 Tax=Sedimentitalea nanhaiensis TaxID=999627 RepID=UPI0012B58A3B|nr:hypothetical protein [Sedimentitalea nanhaiensis]
MSKKFLLPDFDRISSACDGNHDHGCAARHASGDTAAANCIGHAPDHFGLFRR